MYFQGNGKDQPQLLWEHQRWSWFLSSPNLRRIKVKKGKTRFERGLGEIYLQLFHPNQQSSVQAKAGKQEESLAGWPVPLNNRYWCFGLLIYSWIIRLKFLLVFRRAMSLTCLVKLKSLWRTTSVTWSSLVVRMHLYVLFLCFENKSTPSSWGQLAPVLDAKDYFELRRRLNLPSPIFQTVGGRQKDVAANLRKV